MTAFSHQPVFSQTPQNGFALISTANTSRDGSGTMVEIASGGTYGTRISYIRIKATGTTTAGMIRFFHYQVSGPAATNLIIEVPVDAVTPSGSAPTFEYLVDLEYYTNGQQSGLILALDEELYVATNNAEEFAITCYGSNYTQP
jgi:hypothetical protein